jgi:hypothetical protein
MTPNEYLAALLESQALAEDSQELKDLRARGDQVKNLLAAALSAAEPSIRYAGSYMKKTLNKSSYDLDVAFRVPRDNDKAGGTIEEIFDAVKGVLGEHYTLEIKSSAIRLKGLDEDKPDFHIDVVPGRFIDSTKTDVFLHQTSGSKERLQTNLDVHLDHVRDSGVVDAIRVIKILRDRYALPWKTFVLELVVIELLAGHTKDDLETQIVHVLTELRDNIDDISVEDPANSNNDLSALFDSSIRALISGVATSALTEIDAGHWDTVLGPLPSSDEEKERAIRAAGGSVKSKPWRV